MLLVGILAIAKAQLRDNLIQISWDSLNRDSTAGSPTSVGSPLQRDPQREGLLALSSRSPSFPFPSLAITPQCLCIY